MHAISTSFSPTCHYHITSKDSNKPYHNSLALHTNENHTDIISNRQNLKLSPSPLEFVVAHQVHSNTITIIDNKTSHGWNEASTMECDGLITNQKNLVLSILTADCVPILLYDQHNEVIAALHAGWKGTKLSIAKNAIEKMQQKFGSNPKDIVAYIAPSIGQCCYEVGSDVASHFDRDAYTPKEDKYMLNLPYANQKQLLEVGLHKHNIALSNICTACEVDRFFSYRQEGGCSGRFMSMIWMEG